MRGSHFTGERDAIGLLCQKIKKTAKTSDAGFEDFEEMFFSTGKAEKSKTVVVSDKPTSSSSEEDSDEDFGYEGAVEELEMPLDDGSDSTDLYNHVDYDALLDELSFRFGRCCRGIIW